MGQGAMSLAATFEQATFEQAVLIGPITFMIFRSYTLDRSRVISSYLLAYIFPGTLFFVYPITGSHHGMPDHRADPV